MAERSPPQTPSHPHLRRRGRRHPRLAVAPPLVVSSLSHGLPSVERSEGRTGGGDGVADGTSAGPEGSNRGRLRWEKPFLFCFFFFLLDLSVRPRISFAARLQGTGIWSVSPVAISPASLAQIGGICSSIGAETPLGGVILAAGASSCVLQIRGREAEQVDGIDASFCLP